MGLNLIEEWKMTSRTMEKLGEWRDKIRQNIKTEDVNGLQASVKWFLYWRNKLLRENPGKYRRTLKRANKLLATAVTLMNRENQRQIPEITKHRKGTKIRRQKLFNYMYTYEHYIHPLLMETQDIIQIHRTLKQFTSLFEDELLEYGAPTDEFHVTVFNRFIYCMNQVLFGSSLANIVIIQRPAEYLGDSLAVDLLALAE